jgi:PAS domain S-box-containing protein
METKECFKLYDHVNIGVFVVNKEFNIVFWNKHLQEFSGIKKSDVENKNLFSSFPNLDNYIFRERIKGILKGGPPEFFSSQLNKYIVPIKLPNGEYRTQHTSVMGIKNADEGNICAVFSIIDISDEKKQIDNYREMKNKAFFEIEERKKIEDKLREAFEQLKKKSEELNVINHNLTQLNASKDKFFSIMAHDLKNPLGAIISYSDWMFNEFKELSPEEISDSLLAIKKSAKNLFELLENLLNWSRLQTGNMQYSPELFSIKGLFDLLHEMYIILAFNKEIELVFNCSEKMTFFADRNMLLTALRNLISNAIKFTPRKGKIEVAAIKQNHNLTITVKDTGIGMSMEQIDKVFNIENSFTTLGTEREEGTGLGLILVKELVEKNRGQLVVNSKIGNGTVFTLQFNA